MLINLSNHPSDKWPDEQKQSAIAQFGQIADIPFPAIDPIASSADVLRLAQEYAVKCRGQFPPDKGTNAVHIMGEMTFTCAVVVLLQQTGLRCVASTTRRIAETGPDGQKISVFQFCQFRDYPNSEGNR